MNNETNNKKIELFRRLRERNYYHQIYDFETYTKFYDKEKLKYFEDIFEQFRKKKYSDYVIIPEEKKQFYTEKYLNSPILSENQNGINLHFEFDFILFYQLLNYYKNALIRLIEELTKVFPLYYDKNNDAFNIPYESYQYFYKKIDEDMKDAIEFLVRTKTFIIDTNPEFLITHINISLLKERLDTAKNFK